MSKLSKRVSVLLCLIFIAPAILGYIPSLHNTPLAEAATAEVAKLYKTESTLGVYSSPEYLSITNRNYEAKYTYSTADKKIATVNEYGMVTGVGKGKTEIIVEEIYSGNTTPVGTMSVTVVTAKLSSKQVTVGVNSSDYLRLDYSNSKATYSFKSSDPSIVTVDKNGNIKGIKLGKAKVSITETYKKQVKKLGSYTVNVVSSKLSQTEMEVPVLMNSFAMVPIDYYNEKATYTYKSSNTKIIKVDKNGYILGQKVGKATVTVVETYNKIKRDLGPITVNVVNSYINPYYKSIEIGLNSSNKLNDIIYLMYWNWEATYTCKSEDSSIVSASYDKDSWGNDVFIIKGVDLGTSNITVYEEFNGVKRKVGTVAVTVKEYPVISFKLSPEYTDIESGLLTKIYYMGIDYSYYPLNYQIEPYNATNAIIYSSSDESIATINDKGIVTPLGEGTVDITATCGDYTDTIQVTIKSMNDYYLLYGF